MASRSSDDELAPFVLKNVEGLDAGERKGSGAYGAVYEVSVDGVPCIAKRLHDILVDPLVAAKEKVYIRDQFRNECVLLSKLRHPHIVHFVGVHCGENLSLIMERLRTDLASLLEDNFAKEITIPLSVKLSILLDVSYGLLYLHTHTPTIIHRDLTAPNILVTDDMRAKIADLGVSKLLDPHTRAAKAQTRGPGTYFYMPPEALRERALYSCKLDIFSFGHLMLYTVNQEFPQVHEVTVYHPGINNMQIQKRSEAFAKMGNKHCLHPLAIKCLRDIPEQRPSTWELNGSLKWLCTSNPRSVAEFSNERGKITCLQNDVSRLETEKHQMERLHLEKERQMRSLLEEAARNQQTQKMEVDRLKTQVAHIGRLNNELVSEKESLRKELEKAKREPEAMRKKRILSEKQDAFQVKAMMYERLYEEMKSKNAALQMQVEILKSCRPHRDLEYRESRVRLNTYPTDSFSLTQQLEMQGAHHQLQQTRNVAGGTRASTSHYSTRMNDPRYIPMAELYAPPPQPDQDTHPLTQGFHQPNSSEIAPPRAGFATDKYSISDSDHLIRSRRHEYMSIPPLLCKDQGNGENVPMAKFQTLPNRKSKGARPPINQHSPPSDTKCPQSQLLHQQRQQAYDPYVSMSALQNSQDGALSR